jgi:hypothetical protein
VFEKKEGATRLPLIDEGWPERDEPFRHRWVRDDGVAPSFAAHARAFLGHRALHQKNDGHERKHHHGEHPKAVEIGKGRSLLLAQTLQSLPGELLRQGRIAGLLEEKCLGLFGEGMHGRIKGIEILPKAKGVELLAVILQRLAQGPTLPP